MIRRTVRVTILLAVFSLIGVHSVRAADPVRVRRREHGADPVPLSGRDGLSGRNGFLSDKSNGSRFPVPLSSAFLGVSFPSGGRFLP